MTLAEWQQSRLPASRWRRRAREVIQDVVEVLAIAAPAVLADHEELLARVDAAYPFGERRYAPYKCWLAERKLFRAALAGAQELPGPGEADACEVARDMVEAGRLDDARRALEQAPNRLARRCPACGARAGEACIDMTLPIEFIGTAAAELLVPHHARLVGHLDAGPLFTTSPTPLDGEIGT